MFSYLPTETMLLVCVLFNAGEPKEFTLQFRAADNFPLDVYFLLDVTGSFSQSFRDTVPSLAADLCRLNVCVLSFQWRCTCNLYAHTSLCLSPFSCCVCYMYVYTICAWE